MKNVWELPLCCSNKKHARTVLAQRQHGILTFLQKYTLAYFLFDRIIVFVFFSSRASWNNDTCVCVCDIGMETGVLRDGAKYAIPTFVENSWNFFHVQSTLYVCILCKNILQPRVHDAYLYVLYYLQYKLSLRGGQWEQNNVHFFV